MRVIISMLLFCFFFGVMKGQDVKVIEIEGDTIVAVPIKHLPTINGVFEENGWLKKEIALKDSLILTDSLIIRNKDLQLESWIRQEELWKKEMDKERAKRKKLVIGTGIGATLIGILIGVLVR